MRIPLHSTGQEFWPERNVGVLALKLVHSRYNGPWYKKKILYKDKKSLGKFRTRLPIGPSCPTGQEFWPEFSVFVYPLKLVDSKYRGLRKKWMIIYKEKKNLR